MGKDLDSSSLDRNDPGRRGGVTGAGDKTRVIVWANQTQHEDTDDVEEEDPDPYATNGKRDVLGWIVGFSSGHSKNLGSDECIGSPNQHGPETGEAASSSLDIVVLSEGAGIMLCQPGGLFTWPPH